MWNAIAYVNTGLTLIAFIAALAAWIYKRKILENERLIRLAPDDERSRLVEQTLEFFAIDTSNLTKQKQYEVAITQIQARAARFRIAARAIVVIAFLLAVVAAFAIWRESSANRNSIYRVRVMVVGPSGAVESGTEVQSSVGGEKKPIDGGWQIDIPAATVPESQNVTFRGSKESAFLYGEQDVYLTTDFNPTAMIQLKADNSATVGGIVVDEHDDSLISANVSVVGYGDEAIETKRNGQFLLPAHAAKGQQTQLRVERRGYESKTRWVPAGDLDLKIFLKKK